MKAFLTGGTGYVGWEICKRLISDGHEVVALCRQIPMHEKLHGLKWITGKLEDMQSLKEAMYGCTHVFHCAALARAWHPDPNVFFEANVNGTENLLEAAKYHEVEKIVFTSTAGVFGKSLSAPLCEEDPRLEPFDTDYDLTKFLAEEKIRAYAATGRHAVIVNPSRIFGPGKPTPSNVLNNTMLRYVKQPFYLVPGNGNAKGNYVFIEDVVDGHIRAMDKGISGEKYIIGGENISYNELYRIFEKVTGRRRKRISITPPVIGMLAKVMVLWSKVSGGNPFITPAFAKRIFDDRLLSTKKSETQLGCTITPVEEGMSITARHLGIEAPKIQANYSIATS
jgi:nucleoside-diphosphate-sugar epimerase